MVRNKSLISASGGEVESLFLEDLDEVEAISDELRVSQGRGNIILCSVSSPAYRERVLQILSSRFTARVLRIDGGNQLVAALKDQSTKDAEILVWVLPESLSEDLLDALNNFRELFYKKEVPSILFLTPGALDDVIRLAPDFWRYRGGFHELKEIKSDQAFQALENLITPLDLSYRNKEEIQRRRRINEYLLDRIWNKNERIKILQELAIIHAVLGEYHKSIEFSETALAISREIGDRRAEGSNLTNLGIAYSNIGNFRKAIEHYEQALAISLEIGDRRAEGRNLGNLGTAYYHLGDIRKAVEYYEQALAISREISDRRAEGGNLGNLGTAYLDIGNTRKAIDYYEQALAISREIDDRRAEGGSLANLGLACSDLGEIRKAIEYYEKALAISRETGDRRAEGSNLGSLGQAYYNLGNTREAIKYYENALAISQEIGDRMGEGHHLSNLGLAYSDLGETRKAIEYYERALEISQEIEDKKGRRNPIGQPWLCLLPFGRCTKGF